MKKIFLTILCISAILSCKDIIVTEPESNLNVRDFEAAWNRINEVYPYLDFKNINWDSIHTVYRPLVENARGDEFFLVLRDFLAELKDGHVYYRTKGGGKVYPYYPQRHFKDRHAYSPFIVRKYFDKELRLTESKSVEYEILPGNIGYIFLSDFHEDYLINEFPGVMNFLKNTKGIIIDIRQKRGGDYKNVGAVVSRFITEPLEKPPFYWYGKPADLLPFQPAGSAYTNPVAVLINGSTFSAGELCTEVLKQLPNITAIGDTTGGGSVGSGEEGLYFLPSGKSMEIGFIDLRRYDNLPWEWLGVPPDIRVEQTEADILAGRDKQLEYAIDMLNSYE
ncbi:MAG: S41 family peptidase [Melioribacteraceae bacterium]|nr:S41 family peptidase [Melioribacteraceae bacterium]